MRHNPRLQEIRPQAAVLAELAQTASLGQALRYSRQAHQADPDNLQYKQDYAERLMEFGRVEEGAALFKEVIDSAPDAADLQFGLLWNLFYLPGYDRRFFRDQYAHWARICYAGNCPAASHANGVDPDRRLKIGVLSGNFLANSVLSPFESLWPLLEPERFELVPYGNVQRPDSGTERWQALFPGYRDISHLTDLEVAQRIRQDSIDILMEVGGYCRGSRIGVFALKPAPVQVDYGALSTLGLPQVEYRFSSRLLDPPEALSDYLEETVYLSPFLPCVPPSPCPEVGPCPVQENGYITFGVFSNPRKINAKMMGLWSQVLTQVAQSRLVLKMPSGWDPDVREYYLHQFSRRGVDPARLSIHGETRHSDHMILLSQCDLLLDTFPFNGARGTMEALWMGVPTVTLVGDLYVARWGLAMQSGVGLDIFAATSDTEFVAKAVSFASQPAELETIRSSLRGMITGSALGDGRAWIQQFQGGLRYMWRRWCSSSAARR